MKLKTPVKRRIESLAGSVYTLPAGEEVFPVSYWPGIGRVQVSEVGPESRVSEDCFCVEIEDLDLEGMTEADLMRV